MRLRVEDVQNQLRTKDQEMQEKLRAKDQEMEERLKAKDEQISGLDLAVHELMARNGNLIRKCDDLAQTIQNWQELWDRQRIS